MSHDRPTPTEEARELLRGARVFARDDADLLWSALLSLENAAELVEVASRLEWQFHPRGFHNTDLHERYGDGIVPWLATCVDEEGVLHNQPWCVVPCLLACGSAEAFALAWSVARIAGRTPWGGCGDRDLVMAWSERHPEVATDELRRLAPQHVRARSYLRALGQQSSGPPDASEILALLDACAAGLMSTRLMLWPPSNAGELRVVAARAGDDWGIAIERIEGTMPSGFMAARVVVYRFGSCVQGTVEGAASSSRPLRDFDADTFDARVGPPRLVLPGLGLPESATIVRVVSPASTQAARPSESSLYVELADAIAAG